MENKDGIVWMGTKAGGFNALEKNTKRFAHYRYAADKNTSLHSNIVGAILEGRNVDLIARLPLDGYEQRAFKIFSPLLNGSKRKIIML